MSMEIKKLNKKDFPNSLLEIPQPPKELFTAGDLPDQDKFKYLTIVGSRNLSQYGRDVCKKLISGLSGYPIVIVSGLALGTDTLAHEEALSAGLKTVAVPGSGLSEKVLYPRTNLRLAEKIIEAGGCLLSEFKPEFRATPYSFPKRNRIMAGLSSATLIIEAGERSGTMITSRLALDYNRDVLTIPHSIFSKNSYGPHQILKNGARLITSPEDLLDALGFDIKNEAKPKPEMTNMEEKIYNIILNSPATKDKLISELNIETGELNSLISLMEIKGILKETMGEIRLIN